MFTIIGIIVVVGLAYFLFKRLSKSQLDQVEAVVEKVEKELAPVVEKAKTALDVNQDGKVTVADAVEAVKKVRKPRAKTAAKKTAKKTKKA